MNAAKRSTIKQVAAHGGVFTHSATRVVSGGTDRSTAQRIDYRAAGGGNLLGRHPNCGDGATAIPYIRSSRRLRAGGKRVPNSHFSILPKFPSIFESDDQMAQCTGLPRSFGGSNGRSPP